MFAVKYIRLFWYSSGVGLCAVLYPRSARLILPTDLQVEEFSVHKACELTLEHHSREFLSDGTESTGNMRR